MGTPPGFEVIDRVEKPVDKAQLLVLMYLIYRIGPLAASMAVMAGASMKVAYAIHNFMIALLATEATEICAVWDIGHFDFSDEPGMFNVEVFEQANWERLAELAGETVNMEDWRAWLRERACHRLTRASGFSGASAHSVKAPAPTTEEWPIASVS